MSAKWIKGSCLILGISLLLTGCSIGPDVFPPDQDSTPPSLTETDIASEVYDNSLIGVFLDESGTFIDEFEQDWDYSFQIPQLISDAPAAQSVNQELKKILGDIVAKSKADMKEGFPPPYNRIVWGSHWNGSLLSLIISCSCSFHEEVRYWVYNYDFASQQLFNGPDLLKRQAIEEDVFFDALRRTAAAEHDQENMTLSTQYGNCYDAAAELKAQTISAKNLNWDQMKIYLDENEILTAIINRASYAGGGVYRAMLVPDLQPPKQITKTAKCDYVTAELKNGQVTITFHQTAESDWYMPEEGVTYNTPYLIEGLYGIYTDLALGVMGQNIAPYLFLIDTQGRVSFCDISAACRTSAPRFFAAGPLIGIEHAISFETESTPDGHNMYVKTSDGQQLSLFEYTMAMESSLPYLMKSESSWCTDDENFTLHIKEDDAVVAVSWGNCDGPQASGQLYFSGMTEEGLQYPFFMWNEEGGYIGGVLTLECQTNYTASELDNKLTIIQHTGPPLPGIGTDGTAELHYIWMN